MPIDLVHLRASNKLIEDGVTITNKEEFIYGSIFPDALWTVKDITEVFSADSDVRTELHFTVNARPWDMINIFRFYCSHGDRLKTSDFMKGYLFHLLLDIENNLFWESIRKSGSGDKEDEQLVICYNDSIIPCKSIDELCSYKYTDARRYGNQGNIKYLSHNSITPMTIMLCRELFGVSAADIKKSIDVVNISIDTKANKLDNFAIEDSDYEKIINRAINEFKFIKKIEKWD